MQINLLPFYSYSIYFWRENAPFCYTYVHTLTPYNLKYQRISVIAGNQLYSSEGFGPEKNFCVCECDCVWVCVQHHLCEEY